MNKIVDYGRNRKILEIRDAQIIFRTNFGGHARPGSPFDTEGRRTFNVVLDEDVAHKLMDEGWNVKEYVTQDGDSIFHISVRVRVDRPNGMPGIYIITSKDNVKTEITRFDPGISAEENIRLIGQRVEMLDFSDILKADLEIVPYHWHVGSSEGISAYLKNGWFTIYQSDLQQEYSQYEEKQAELEHPQDDGEQIPF